VFGLKLKLLNLLLLIKLLNYYFKRSS